MAPTDVPEVPPAGLPIGLRLWVLRLAGLVSSLLLLALVGACAPERGPELVELRDLSGTLLEERSDVALVGVEFPPGRKAKLTLRGALFAPAREPRRLDWTFERIAESSTRIPLRLSAGEIETVLGDAEHGTFRGELVAEFSPLRSGGPTLAGRLEGLVVDIFASRARASLGAAAVGPGEFAGFLGVSFDARFSVLGVEVGGPGDQAGLVVGDRLLELDGVHLELPSDFAPRALARTSQLVVARTGELDSLALDVDRAEFEGGAHQLSQSLLLSLGATLLGLLVAARPPRLWRWFSFRRAVGDSVRAKSGSRLGWASLAGLVVALVLEQLSASPTWGALLPSGGLLTLLLGLMAYGMALLGPPPARVARRTGRRARDLLWSVAVIFPVLLGGAVVGFEAGGLVAVGVDPGGARPTAPWPLVDSPWQLLAAIGFAVSLLQVASLGQVRPGTRRNWASFSLAVLCLFWASSFLTPPASWPEPLRAVFLAWAALALQEAIALLAAGLGHELGTDPFVLRLGIGAALLAAVFFLLASRVTAFRSLPGLSAATATFLFVCLAACSWASSRAWFRQGVPADPWL